MLQTEETSIASAAGWPDHVCRYALSPELTTPNTPPGCIGKGADNPRGGIYQVCKTT